MASKRRASLPEDNIRKVYKNARRRVMSDPDVLEYIHRRPFLKQRLIFIFWRTSPTVITNVKLMKDNSIKEYKQLVKYQINVLDDTIENYAKSNSVLPFNIEKPRLLCKYMPKGHAVSNICKSETKFGSVGDYRRDDITECALPIAPEMNTDEFLDIVGAKVLKLILEEQNLDIKSIWNNVQDYIEHNFFIGSFSDGANSEYMWHEYAKDDGVCVWFEPDYTKLKLVVYSDYLAKADDLREEYREMLVRIAKEGFDSLKGKLKSLTEEIINLSIMAFFTKKSEFSKETEWRQLVTDKNSTRYESEDKREFILSPIPGRIVKIESRLPEEEFSKLTTNINSRIEIIRSFSKSV